MPKKTSLFDTHVSLGAKMVDFAGFEMPVLYNSVIEEHLAVRKFCGIFDVGHMGEIEFSGPKAFFALQWLTCNNIGHIGDSQAQYTLLCYPQGGVIDDVIVYRIKEDRFLMVTNASNTEKVFNWVSENARKGVTIEDVSESTALIALQGPLAQKALSAVSRFNPETLRSFYMKPATICGIKCVISKTGYTGEDGFEIYLNPLHATEVFEGLLEKAGPLGLKPVGLGARDTLRLEMGYPLYGAELTKDTTPVEAGLERFINQGREDFIGKDVLMKQISDGVDKKLVGFIMLEKGIARAGYDITSEGRKIGAVTSGTYSPSLKRAIGLGYVEPSFSNLGDSIEITIRGKGVKAQITKKPFYTKTTF